MSVILTLRVTAEQRKRWQDATNVEGLTLSGWIRERCEAGRREKNENEAPKRSPAEQLAALRDFAQESLD